MTDTISDTPTPDTAEATPPAPPSPPSESDLGEILPDPGAPFRIGAAAPDGGVMVQVNRLKTREFLALMKFLTAGLAPTLGDLDFSQDPEEMAGEMLGMLIIAVPNAADEFIDFVGAVTVPVGKSPEDAAKAKRELDNLDPDDLLEIAERVVTQEAPDIQRLMGKVQAMWGRMQKVYARSRPAG